MDLLKAQVVLASYGGGVDAGEQPHVALGRKGGIEEMNCRSVDLFGSYQIMLDSPVMGASDVGR